MNSSRPGGIVRTANYLRCLPGMQLLSAAGSETAIIGPWGGIRMRFKRLDLNLLVALDALLRERSVSRAAERIHLSQSAMSNALARLRDYFDDELLVPIGRKFELTPRAEMLAGAVRDVLLRVDTTIAAQPEFIPAESNRTFSLLVSEYTTTVLIPTLLALVWKESQGIRFRLLPQTEEPERMLSSGDADILVMPSAFLASAHPSEPLYEDDFVCVVWQGNPNIGETLSVDDYIAAPHVAVEIGADRVSFEGWFMKRFGIERRLAVTTSSLTAPCQLVVGTDCIATTHARIARQAARTLPIRLLPSPIEIPRLVQAMQWHKYRTQDPGLVWLRQRLRLAASMIDAGFGSEHTEPTAVAGSSI